MPYEGISNVRVVTLVLVENKTLEIPDCDPLIKDLIQSCFDRDPKKRPSFQEICQLLDNFPENVFSQKK